MCSIEKVPFLVKANTVSCRSTGWMFGSTSTLNKSVIDRSDTNTSYVRPRPMVLISSRWKCVCSEIQSFLYRTPPPVVWISSRWKRVCSEIQWILYRTPLPMAGSGTLGWVFARKYNDFCTIHHLLWLDIVPVKECLLRNTMISVQNNYFNG